MQTTSFGLCQAREKVKMLATEAIDMIEDWMHGVKLQIAHHEMKLLLVSNGKAVQQAEITDGGHIIPSKYALKYLGVMIDDWLNFNRLGESGEGHQRDSQNYAEQLWT